MAVVNCCLLVASTAVPSSQDSENASYSLSHSTISRPSTKIILPNKNPMKLSTGVGPEEYASPPITTKLRKYYGGDKDPLASDDYLWNKEFMARMKKLIHKPDDDVASSTVKEKPSGFLSLNRVMSLDNLELDLSEKLAASPKSEKTQLTEESNVKVTRSRRWKSAPTRRELEKWDRATKAATGLGNDAIVRDTKQPREDPEVSAAQSREEYYKLKNKLQILTLGIGGVGLISSYFSYSPEISTSYGAGFLGSLAYMKMLGNSIDSMADGARGLIKGAIGQPRLLVPVILVMLYNRWNEILVPEYGFMQLEMIPMLVGFFTYKFATFVLAINEAVGQIGGRARI